MAMWDSPVSFLNDHFSDMFESVISLNVPLISAQDYLRRIHISQYVKPIKEILILTYDEKEKLLAPLVEMISSLDVSDPGLTAKMLKKSREKIEHDPEYGKIIEKMSTYFNSLKPEQKIHVLNITIGKIENRAGLMRSAISRQITQVENPSQFLVLDQMLYLAQEFARKSMILIRKIDPKNLKSLETELGLMLRVLLNIEDARRNGVSVDKMTSEVSLLSMCVAPKHLVMEERMAKPLLAALEG